MEFPAFTLLTYYYYHNIRLYATEVIKWQQGDGDVLQPFTYQLAHTEKNAFELIRNLQELFGFCSNFFVIRINLFEILAIYLEFLSNLLGILANYSESSAIY